MPKYVIYLRTRKEVTREILVNLFLVYINPQFLSIQKVNHLPEP